MTITNGYATRDQFIDWAQIDRTVDVAQIDRAIETVSRWIDGYCSRQFWQATAATRTFVPYDDYRVKTGDLVSVTTVKTGTGDGTFTTTWAASDYQLWPLNPADGPELGPYTELRTVGTRTFPIAGTGRPDVVQIVGTFGWPAVPTAVTQACLIQATRLYGRRYSQNGIVGAGDFAFRVSTRLDPDVADLLFEYTRTVAVA